MATKRAGKIFERPPEYEDEPPQPYWPSFAEKLLLTIIDAHPPSNIDGKRRAQSSDRQSRLETAMNALFGVSRPVGHKFTYTLHALMASANDIWNQSLAVFENTEVIYLPKSLRTKARSKRVSARAVSALAESNSLESSTELLRKSERKMRNYLAQIVQLNHHQEEEDMERDLRAVSRILAKWNIELSIDAEALGMASLWGRKLPD